MTIIFLLGLVFAGFQIGLIGYYQLALDAGSHIEARAVGLMNPIDSPGTISTVQQLVSQSFPILSTSEHSVPTLQQPIDVNFNGMNFGSSNSSGSKLVAAYNPTLMQPNLQAISQTQNLQIGGHVISLSSVAVEAAVEYITSQNGSLAQSQAFPYFTSSDGDDMYPFMLSITQGLICNDSPLVDYSVPDPSPWNSCPVHKNLRPLGLAAHLDQANDYYTGGSNNAMYLDPSYSGVQNAPPDVTQAGPFFETWCHRNIYAWIEQLGFPDNGDDSIPPYPADPAAWLGKLFNPLDPTTQLPVGPLKPGSIIYNASPGDAQLSGWDDSGDQSTWPVFSWQANYVAPWYGCGITPGG